MSYDLGLYINDVPVKVKHFAEGGTQVMGGTDDAELNITYNYSWFYYQCLDKENGLRWLYGKSGKEAEPRLSAAVEILGTRQNSDYWADTPGNAGHALNILLEWARQYPDAIFNGD